MNYYLTGDLHGEGMRLANLIDKLDENDTLIVLGDFGFIWDNSLELERTMLDALEKALPYTIAFVDGNHENFPMIQELETIEEWNGGRIGRISKNIIHLLRGEVYNLNGKKVGVCGGADSIDISWRTQGISWWPEERIGVQDVQNFLEKTKNTKLDLVLTHDCPAFLVPLVKIYSNINEVSEPSVSQQRLQEIYNETTFAKWYFGHWHMDRQLTEQFECLYNTIKPI